MRNVPKYKKAYERERKCKYTEKSKSRYITNTKTTNILWKAKYISWNWLGQETSSKQIQVSINVYVDARLK